MIGYKLFRKLKSGELAPLFINKKQRIPLDIWLPAEDHKTKGFAHRPGWHICSKKYAPHLSTKGRVWCKVVFENYAQLNRPVSQGGKWFLAQKMKVLKEL